MLFYKLDSDYDFIILLIILIQKNICQFKLHLKYFLLHHQLCSPFVYFLQSYIVIKYYTAAK